MKLSCKDKTANPLGRLCLYVCSAVMALYAVACVLFYFLTRQQTFYSADGNMNFLGRNYLLLTLGVGALLLLLCLFTVWQGSKSHMVFPVSIIENFRRYGFLIRQLVRRDFKTKYKRSVLGVLWSFLNPLLMMAVQFVVFSSIFRIGGSEQDFPVYLMIGIVLFNAFSESSTMGLTAITTNASLINKAYVPKYIYPLCKVFSSLINMGFSLIPLFAIIALRIGQGKVPMVSPAYLLLIYDIACLLLFCFGISLLLSALMVFFRDIQFLWGVILTVWTYLTPMFYDVKMLNLSPTLMKLYNLNPLYQFIKFARTIVLDGVSPSLTSFLACGACAIIACVIGCFVFQKTQKKFVLYL